MRSTKAAEASTQAVSPALMAGAAGAAAAGAAAVTGAAASWAQTDPAVIKEKPAVAKAADFPFNMPSQYLNSPIPLSSSFKMAYFSSGLYCRIFFFVFKRQSCSFTAIEDFLI